MCGIIGVVTKEKTNIVPILTGSLARLEYRGYDSAGVAILDDSTIHVHKCMGAPSEYLRDSDIKTNILSSTGIGHNRWATHGKPTIANAHPHLDESERVAVVHNGTILNYETLKKELQEQGITFSSETDTEVIPQLIALYLRKGDDMRAAFLKTIERLDGAYGVVAFDMKNPGVLYVAKEGSPIVIGKGGDAWYVASSVHAFITFTKDYITLMDGEMAIVYGNRDPVIIHTKSQKTIKERQEQKAEIDSSDLSKGEFETFMLKEIYEQPTTTQSSIAGRIDEEKGLAVLGGLFDHSHLLEDIRHVVMTGCGTAYNAGDIAGCVLESLTPVSVRNEIASEGLYRTLHLPKKETVVIAVSQSGETADTVEYIKELKRKGYETFGVVNVVGSTLAHLTGKGVYTKAGAEVGVASTKAFTSQLAVLYLFVLYIARMQSLSASAGKLFARSLSSMPGHMKALLESGEGLQELASKYIHLNKIQFLGRGIHVPVAKEAALKFKELTYIEAGAYPLGELKHGPIAIVDDETLSVVFLPKDPLFDQGVSSVEQIKSKGGKVVLITDESTKGHPIVEKVDDVVYIPKLEDALFYPFLEIIPVQLFAYHFAKLLGRNIDKPRNLAKSVTVQ